MIYIKNISEWVSGRLIEKVTTREAIASKNIWYPGMCFAYGQTISKPVSRQNKLRLEVHTPTTTTINFWLIFHEEKVEDTVEKSVDEISEAEVEYEQIHDGSNFPVNSK